MRSLTVFLLSVLSTTSIAAPPATQPTASQCIDALLKLTRDQYTIETNVLGTENNPIDDHAPGFRTLGSQPPPPSRAIEQIEALGAAAVPALLEHLTDSRKTQVALPMDFWGQWYDLEFDVNPRTDKKYGTIERPSRELMEMREVPRGDYVMSVGEVCFDVLGRIVNRSYRPVRYQPTMCCIVNSPTRDVILADAARARWNETTDESLKQSLIADLQHPDHIDRATGALLLLKRHYPIAAQAEIITIFRQPCYSFRLLYNFTVNLRKLDSAQRQRDEVKTFLENYGPHYRDLLIAELEDEIHRENDASASAEAVLKAVFPEQVGKPKPDAETWSIDSLADLVKVMPHSAALAGEVKSLQERVDAMAIPQEDKDSLHQAMEDWKKTQL